MPTVCLSARKTLDVGPSVGWPPHESKAESLEVIKNVLNGTECYAICKKGSDKASAQSS